MATSINTATIVGHLGRDPEIRHTANGTMVANMSVATSMTWLDKDGARKEKTTWHKVTAWGKLAEICEKALKKGHRVFISGAMILESWEAKDGTTKERIGIKADQVVGMQASHVEGEAGDGPQSAPAPYDVAPQAQPERQRPITRSWDQDTDEMPF